MYKKIIILILFIQVLMACDIDKSPLKSSYKDSKLGKNSLCYQKGMEKYWQIVLMQGLSQNPLNISKNPSNDAYNPVWSPTGEYIAFRYDMGIGGADIYLYNISSDTSFSITPDLGLNESASPVMWTPDGEKLIYHHKTLGEQTDYNIMNNNGINKKFILNGQIGHDLQRIVGFFPDSYHFIFSYKGNVYKTNIDRTFTDTLVTENRLGGHLIYVFDFDPFNERILYARTSLRWTGIFDSILLYNLKNSNIDTVAFIPQSQSGSFLHNPVFNHDFSKIAYTKSKNDLASHTLYIYKDGVSRVLKKALVDWNNPSFSPRENYICFEQCEFNSSNTTVSFKSQVYIINVNTKVMIQIGDGKNTQWNPLFNF